MNWDDEQFVKIYTRDTGEWTMLSWDAQALLVQILRKVDRSGVLQLGKHGTRVLAATLGHRDQQARILPALAELELDGCVLVRPDRLVVPNFVAAQTSRQSDKARQQAARDRRRAESMKSGSLQDAAKTSQNVTDCHPASPGVTPDHPASPGVTLDKTRLDKTRLDLSLVDSEPKQPELKLEPQQAADANQKPKEPSKAQIQAQVALGLFAELVAARMSVIAGAEQLQPRPAALAGIKASLGQGYTPDQIRHVIKLKAAEVRADPGQARWFVPKWFHPANVEQYYALSEADVTSVKGGRRPSKSPADIKREAELDAYFARQDRKHDAIEVASEETRRDF